jgi:hypothetical protein
MVNDWLTGAAVAYTIPPLVPPVCAATMVHRPDATIDTVPPLVTVQVALVDEVNVTGNPDSLVAVTGKSAAVTF